MSTKGNQISTEAFLRSVALPEKTKTYTPITHGDIIDKLAAELSNANFVIEGTEYVHTFGGEVAVGKVYIRSTKDPEMGMLFSWANSYNKKVKFSCGVGAFVYENKTSFFGTEGLSWIRKHTGTANAEAFTIIEQIVDHAHYHFDKIIAEKNRMKAQPISIESYGRVMGALFFEHELLKPTQVNIVDREFKDDKSPVTSKDSLWGLYKIIMFGIEGTDITKWQQSQQKLHHMIMAEYALSQEEMHLKDSNDMLGNAESDIAKAIDTADKGLESHSVVVLDLAEETVEEGINTLMKDEMANHTGNAIPLVDDRAEWADKVLAEEPKSEDVGPPEMYIAGVDTADAESESSVVVAKVHDDGKIEVVSEDESSFINVAIQLGYTKESAETFIQELYDSEKAVSLNLKEYRLWADGGGMAKEPEVTAVIDGASYPIEAVEAAGESANVDSLATVEYLPAEEVIERYGDNMTEEQLATISKVPEESFGEKPSEEVGVKALEIQRDEEPKGPKVIINKVNMEEERKRFEEKDAEMKRAQYPVTVEDAFKSPIDGFTSMAVNAGYGKDLVEFYAGDHFDNNLEIAENYDAFVAWAPKPKVEAPTVDLSEIEGTHTLEEMPEIIAKVEEKIEEAKTIVEPALNIDATTEHHQASLDVLFSAEVKKESSIEPIVIPEEPVAIIEPKPVAVEEKEEEVDPFDVGDEDFLDVREQEGLEVPKETRELAEAIEKKMAILYGTVKPYQVIEAENQINVIIDGSEECFYMPLT